MKKTLAIFAAILSVGFIGIQTAGAHFGPQNNYRQHAAYTGRHMGPGPGSMHRAIATDTGQGFYCPTNFRGHRDAGPHHRTGYGPRHWRGPRW